MRVHGVFAYVLFIVCGLGILIGFLMLMGGSAGAWDEIGKHGLLMERYRGVSAEGTTADSAEREAEIAQMLEAINAGRARHGREAFDLSVEEARLNLAKVDPDLLDEVRSMVEATNSRRLRRGLEPLDIETETVRRLAELS